MGLFDRIKKKETVEKSVKEYFNLMNSYTPAFSSFEGGLYEMELTRAAIHSFATHVSKLQPEVNGSNNESLARILKYKPNALMDTKKYLYRLATVYMVDNTAFIVPLYDKFGNISGYYPLATEKCRIVDYEGKKYLRYEFSQGNVGAIELERAGIINQFQYRDELFGESNSCMRPTMELINTNNQGIIEGVKSSASIRFMAKLATTLKAKDIDAERDRFVESNLSSKNSGGVLMFDQKYENVQQIHSTPYTVDPSQLKAIRDNVFQYFGTNEKILTNNFTSSEWNAYYEGKIEPFAIELSLVHTNMTFTDREKAFGNEILFTANRLQYMSAAEKVQMVTALFDRGFISMNDGREIFNLAPVENGDRRYIRKEYIDTSLATKEMKDVTEGGLDDYAGAENEGIQTDESADAGEPATGSEEV